MNSGTIYELFRLGDAFPSLYDRHPALVSLESGLERGRSVELELLPSAFAHDDRRFVFGELRTGTGPAFTTPHASLSAADGSLRLCLFPPEYPGTSAVFATAYPDTGSQLLTLEFATGPTGAGHMPTAVWRRKPDAVPSLQVLSTDDLSALVSDFITLGQGAISTETGPERIRELMQYVLDRPALLRDEVREGLRRLTPLARQERGEDWHAYLLACGEVLDECRSLATDGRWELARQSIHAGRASTD